jgi:hypothetical protein
MESLFVGNISYYSHISSTIAILTITNKATTSKALQMDGFSTTIPLGYQV